MTRITIRLDSRVVIPLLVSIPFYLMGYVVTDIRSVTFLMGISLALLCVSTLVAYCTKKCITECRHTLVAFCLWVILATGMMFGLPLTFLYLWTWVIYGIYHFDFWWRLLK